jgi:hypothetical protein
VKYGKPQQLRTLQKYNRVGAIMSLEAMWRVQGIYILFTGAESMRAGTSAIKSEKKKRWRKDEQHGQGNSRLSKFGGSVPPVAKPLQAAAPRRLFFS